MAGAAADFGNSLASTAMNTGQSAINSYDPTASANSVRGGYNSLFGSQTGTGNQFVDSFKGATAAQPQLQDVYGKASTMFDLPNLQKQASYLNNQVAFQPEIQQNLARGFDVSQPQVDSATNYNLMRLGPMANMATQNMQNAANLTQGYMTQAQNQEAFNLHPYDVQGQMLNDAMARQSSGFNIAAQSELDGYIEKMRQGVQLSQMEMDRANTLAAQETSYQNTLTTANASIKTAQIQNQNVVLPYGSSYLNANTGQGYKPYG